MAFKGRKNNVAPSSLNGENEENLFSVSKIMGIPGWLIDSLVDGTLKKEEEENNL